MLRCRLDRCARSGSSRTPTTQIHLEMPTLNEWYLRFLIDSGQLRSDLVPAKNRLRIIDRGRKEG